MKRLRIWIGVAFLTGWMLFSAGCGQSSIWGDGLSGTPGVGIGAGGTGGASTTGTGGTVLFPSGGAWGGDTCEGNCVPSHADGFEGLSMYWIGPPGNVPPCPESAPFAGSKHWGDLAKPDPPSCPACSCSTAACALPELMDISAAPCPGNGAQSLPFDAPAGWTEGTCTDEDAIPTGLKCAGGVLCAQSLTIEAPRVEPCIASPVAEDVGVPPPPWGLVAQECILGTLPHEGCETTGAACAPPPPPGFRLCVYRSGDDAAVPCVAPYDDERFVMYLGWHDTRACSPCECGDPQGADCWASIDVFTDTACGTFLGSFPLSNAIPATCFGLPPGAGLGSKSGSFLVDMPGTCEVKGGKASGDVMPSGPVTLCCMPPTPPEAP